MKFVSYSALIVFMLLLGGCIPIPLVLPADEEPFKEVIGRIQIGETSRDGVMEILGEPKAFLMDPEIHYYAEFHFTGFQGVVIIAALGPGILWFGAEPLGVGGSTVLALAIQFDETGIVSSVDRLPEGPCKSTVPCLGYAYFKRDDKAYELFLFAPEEDDAAAKQFHPKRDSCSVYLFAKLDDDFPSRLRLKATLGSAPFPTRLLYSGGYQLWHLSPGQHRIYIEAVGLVRRKRIELRCDAGEVKYLEFRNSFGIFAGYAEEFQFLDAKVGKEGVRQRNLIWNYSTVFATGNIPWKRSGAVPEADSGSAVKKASASARRVLHQTGNSKFPANFRFASIPKEVTAKRFEPDPKHCSIYIFHLRSTFYLDGTVVTVYLDRTLGLDIDRSAKIPWRGSGFLWLKTVPGRHNLELDKFSIWDNRRLQDRYSFPFVCKEGQITFLKGSIYFGGGQRNLKLQHVSEEEGKKAVRDMVLIEHFFPESTGRNDK